MAAYCRKIELKYNLQPVLSPRQFLSQEQRLVPRHDRRKAQIREHIIESLAISRCYEEFERLMKEKKYEVIKGRGIAFRDEKKVYVKGSELGYSLQSIERILEQNKIALNRPLQEWKQVNKSAPYQPFSREQSFQGQDHSPARGLAKELSKAMNHLMKPEQINEQPPKELTYTKKKKKGLRPD